jgi:hypothetical protein
MVQVATSAIKLIQKKTQSFYVFLYIGVHLNVSSQ